MMIPDPETPRAIARPREASLFHDLELARMVRAGQAPAEPPRPALRPARFRLAAALRALADQLEPAA